MFRTHIQKIAFIFVISILFFLASSPGFAAINLENRTGTIVLTTSSNQVQTIEKDQSLPQIESGTTIEVVTGGAHIASGPGDVVNVIVNNDKVVLRDKGKIEIHKDIQTGRAVLKVVEGKIEIVKEDGTTETLEAGQSFEIKSSVPTALDQTLPPGTDSADNVGRQTDTELGKVQGY